MAALTNQERRRSVDQMLASWRIEGFEPCPRYMALLNQYAAGEIALGEIKISA